MLLELRAAQRTFEGAYVRAAIAQFVFALFVLKVFSEAFYGVGIAFGVFGGGMMGAGWLRRREGRRVLVEVGERRKFQTSGNVVVVVCAVSLCVYAMIGELIWRL